MCPEALKAVMDANVHHAGAYGNDPWTRQASDQICQTFEIECDVFFVFNGTAANSLVLASLCESYHSILCHELAHIETDECGAPEFFSNGTKLLQARGESGRIDVNSLQQIVSKRTDVHFPKPRVVSITQATEVGTIYRPGDILAISEFAKSHGLHVHMDGARFANAVATLGISPKELTWKVGVDVLCFGGSKNGLSIGEAVVFFNRELAYEFEYRCKQAGQLCSKMRFLSAPWVGLLTDNVWLRNARHANAMAKRLESRIAKIPSVGLMYPSEANSVFVEMPPAMITELRNQGWQFYTFIGTGGCRLMCSWDTDPRDVDAIADAMIEIAKELTPQPLAAQC